MFDRYGKKDRQLIISIDNQVYDVRLAIERLEIKLEELLEVNKKILAALTGSPGTGTKPVALKFILGVAKEKTNG